MNCLICNTEMNYFFSKDFHNEFDLVKIEYHKCGVCGFVLSYSHANMPITDWENLNHKFHEHIENLSNIKTVNQPPYIEQATFINILIKNKIISADILDWGCGYGTLSKILAKYYDINISIYDKYMNSVPLVKRKYKTIFNSAVFEHVTKRDYLDEINSYASECMILHTLIREEIPNDPNWFYLLPVHTAFHTNKSMELLMNQWGYASSIYCPLAKCWALLKKQISKDVIKAINDEFQSEYLYCKNGFMDYWK